MWNKIKAIFAVFGTILLFAIGIILSGGIIDTKSGSETPEPILFYVLKQVNGRKEDPVVERSTSRGTPIVDSESFFDFDDIEMIETPDSSCFSEIGYDRGSGTLVVTFRDSGDSYAYDEVPKSVWNDFFDAESMGSYYNQKIKGLFDCVKLD